MALVVNTNVNSLKAQRDLTRTRSNLTTAMQRISSGVRINSAGDDPVGMGISARMTSQIKGLSVAIKNSNDGISFVQTAEGALQEVTTLLQRMQELAVQASNESNSSADHFAMQAQMIQINNEITRISEETEFNGTKLLLGDIVNAEFQVGIRFEQTIRVSIAATASAHIGSFSTQSNNVSALALGSAVSGIAEAPPNPLEAQTITVRGFMSDVEASTISIDSGETARSIAEKVNAKEGQSGISATTKTEMTLADVFAAAEGGQQTLSFRLYGRNAKNAGVTSNAAVITATVTGNTEEGLSPLLSAINAQNAVTGISASFVDGTIKLVENQGDNISLEGFTNTNQDPSLVASNTMEVTGMEGTLSVIVTEGAEDSVTVGGTVSFSSPKAFTVTSDAGPESSLFLTGYFDGITALLQGSDFSPLANVSLLDVTQAAEALRIITGALDFVSALRGELGALQNRFESTIENLGAVQENVEAARSRVEDADFAEETAKLTKAQILQEAGIAILAQANTIPQTVLALLRA